MIHTHVHTSFSFLDSTNRIPQLIDRAKELGMEAIAITDHGVVSGLVDMYKAGKKAGVKVLLGVELYVCSDMKNQDNDNRYDHLIVIAKNNTGYKNLLALSSLGFTEGFYYKPRIDMKTLYQHREGLIIQTACLGGTIPKMILSGLTFINGKATGKPNNTYDNIKTEVLRYKSIFQDFYLEIQGADNAEQAYVNKMMEVLSKDTGVPLVATSDVHFLKKEDHELHGIFIQINQDRDNELYQDCWLKTEDEMLEVLTKHISLDSAMEAIQNTHRIADMCDVDLELGIPYLPDFPVPSQFKCEDDYLWHLIEVGFKERQFHLLPQEEQDKRWARLRYEHDIITQKGYSGYFLIVRDLIQTAEENNILIGDGRGSANNSLICFVTGITNVDSIKYDLNFSRFLTLERTALPDIDNDVQTSQRQHLINLIKDKWGHDKVAQICTFGSLQAKSAIDSIGKVLGLSYNTTTEIKKYIPDGTTLKEALVGNEKLIEYKNEYPKLFDYVLRLEGIERGTSTHAGGVVITPSSMNMSDFCGVALSKDKEEITQLEMHNIEEAGLVKIDLLGLNTLDIIDDTLKFIGKDKSFLDVSTLDFDDKKVYEMLQRGETDFLFQINGSGMKDTCVKLQPTTMEDIIAILALYRPDTMPYLNHYINRKHGREEIEYIHPDLEPILGKTYGNLVFQEQIMAIAQKFAGFSDGEQDDLRKGLGKKDKTIVETQANKFRVRTIANGYSADIANDLADMLIKMGNYLFNKGHASGYGITTYKTAYLKAHYPVEYMASVLSNQKKESGGADYEKVGQGISTCKEMGIPVKNPNINISDKTFTPSEGSILYGFNLIKGLSQTTIEFILENRPFKNFDDFINKAEQAKGVDKTSIIALIKSGAFDFSGESREDLLLQYGKIRFESGKEAIKPISNINKNHIEVLLKENKITLAQSKNKTLCLDILNKDRATQFIREWKDTIMDGDEFMWEFQVISYSIKGNPFEGYNLPLWEEYEEGDSNAEFFGVVSAISKTKIKRGNQKGMTMAFIKFETPEGTREGICFANEWQRLQNRLEKGTKVVVRGTKQGEQSIINGIMMFDLWKDKYGKL